MTDRVKNVYQQLVGNLELEEIRVLTRELSWYIMEQDETLHNSVKAMEDSESEE